jgi:2-hydroxymuconate-semialdehyde hydrolase
MTKEQVYETLRSFIVSELLDGQGDDLEADTSLLELGIVDSLSMISLLTFMEEKFSVSVPDYEVKPENFQNLAALTKFTLRLMPTKVH